MLLKSLHLENILSFGPDGVDLELRPLNVLIGPNGSGKSNLIEIVGLPQRDNVEGVAKADLTRALEAATRGTKSKGSYDKGGHSFTLLGLIEPRAVAARSPFAARFFDALRRYCGA